MWFAVRSVRIVLSILITLIVGLALTTGIGLAVIGVFNIISVAFVALFVGLGVDFAIQFSVRYRAERHRSVNLDEALRSAGRMVGEPLALAAVRWRVRNAVTTCSCVLRKRVIVRTWPPRTSSRVERSGVERSRVDGGAGTT